MSSTSRLGSAALLLAFVFLAWAYAAFMRAPTVGIFHDDGLYLVTAQALAEGHGYRIVSIPGEPTQTKYPILFPWLLSLVWRVYPTFPDNLFWLRMVPLGASVAWLWLSWRLMRRLRASRPTASFALLLTAATPWVLFLSTTLLSETLYAALFTGGLLLIVQIDAGEGRRFDGLLAGLLVGASLLTRTAGVAPAAAGLLALAMRRRWSACGQFAIGVLVLAVRWSWWVAQHAPEPMVDSFYSASNYGSWNLVSGYTWPDRLAVLGVNTLHVVNLGQFWGLSAETTPGLITGALCTVLVIRGLWIARASPVAMLVTLYVAMLLAWVWPPVRFVAPVLPLLVWLASVGAGRLRPVAGVLAAALLMSAGVAVWRLATQARETGRTWYAATGYDWRAMTRQYEWINRETPRNAVLTGIHDPTYYLFTGRKALRPFSFDPLLLFYNVRGRADNPFGTADDFRRRLIALGADYVIVTPNDGLERLIRELLMAAPGTLTPVNGSPESGQVIYQVHRNRLPGRIE